MNRNSTFRFTSDDIEELRDLRLPQKLIDAYTAWVAISHQLDPLISQIEEAFAGSTLGDGIGLLEADGIDDYASKEELAILRSRDEQIDWRRIPIDRMSRCYASPTFMDAKGFVFHLPAFLIAELNDQHPYGFIDRLISKESHPEGWGRLLNAEQREALCVALRLIVQNPSYGEQSREIAEAIERLS